MAKVNKNGKPRKSRKLTFATAQQVEALKQLAHNFNGDSKAFRLAIRALGIFDETAFHYQDLADLLKVFSLRYQADNKGLYGILNEIEQRVNQAIAQKRALKYRDFWVRNRDKVDNHFKGYDIEDKAGTGDWLYSDYLTTREEIIETYRRRNSLIRLNIEDYGIHIIMPWPDFLAMLDEYNPATGCATFFNSQVRYKDEKFVVRFQPINTSKRKIAWLVAHNCDILSGDDE